MIDPHHIIGQTIGDYHITHLLGQGGMAAVYLANDQVLHREIVLKIMLPALAQNAELCRRFEREARATARLSHPNIVPIFTTGKIPSGEPYIVLQYIEGGSLADYLRKLQQQGQWISTIYALGITRQIADALIIAHEAGIIHRDLKPSNILLRKDGAPVLSDLGIAALKTESTRLTHTDQLIGTPDYMSPEQAMSYAAIDGRSDIYSLGIILYELLSGHLPFQADTPLGVLHQHIYEQPAPLPQFRPDLSDQTIHVVATCMQKKPEHRFADARHLVVALDEAIAAEDKNPVVSLGTWRPPTGPSVVAQAAHNRQPPQRKRPYWIIALVCLLPLLCLAALAVWDSRSNEPPPLPSFTPSSTATLTPTSVPATAVSPTSTLNPTVTPTTMTSTPTATLTATPSPTSPAPVANPDFPQGLIAYGCGPVGDKQIYLYNPATSQEFLLPGQPSNSIVPAFSPDGTQIAYRSDDSGSWQIIASNLDGTNWRQITSGPAENYEAAWSPDGRQFVFVSDRNGEKQLFTMNVDGTNQTLLTNTPNNVRNDDPNWSVTNVIAYESNPDGRHRIYTISPAGGTAVALISQGDSTTTPAWSPDGQRIAFEVLNNNTWHIWTATNAATSLQQMTTEGANNLRPAWSPDGAYLVFHSNYQQPDPEDFDIWTIHLDTGGLRRLSTRGTCFNPAWGQPTAPVTLAE